MRRHHLAATAAIFLLGCPFDTAPEATDHESSSEAGDDGDDGYDSVTITVTSAPPPESSSDESDSGSDGSTDESGSEGSTEAGSSESSSESSESGSSTGDPPDAYLPCDASDQSCTEDTYCVLGEDGTSGWCTQGCNAPSDCPDAPDGSDATPVCTYYGPSLACMLSCADGETCPEGTQCEDMYETVLGSLMNVCV